jgi:hypothetical protein
VTVRKSAAAIACAAAITAGAVAAATPASAGGPGSARYNCGPYGSSVAMTYSRPGVNPLNMVIIMPTGFPPSTVAGTTLNGVGPGPSGPVGSGAMGLSGPFAVLPSAPTNVVITFTNAGIVLGIANCFYVAGTQTGSWPV